MLNKLIVKLYDYIDHFIPNLKLKRKMKETINQTPALVLEMRRKKTIKVLFIISCLSKWKTESLYVRMMNNPRFEPIIGVALMTLDYPSEVLSKYIQLKDYLNKNCYSFTEICSTADLEGIHPDIIFHQEAAGGGILDSLMFYSYSKCLYCYITYGLFIPSEIKLINTPYHNICWKFFLESPLLVEYAKRIMDNHGSNAVFTGVPMTDKYFESKDAYSDPWKVTSCKKRIIWAPHHSILERDLLHSGTFLLYSELMLKFASKYKDVVQWAFKPHPVLRGKLNHIWGKEKTDLYYNQWATMANTQLEEGEYVALFKYSDALIHDCCSFMVEYLYVDKPCMYLEKDSKNDFNPFGKRCYEQYYLGHNEGEINRFIDNVINGIDELKSQRKLFVQNNLLPPNGKTACENIISEILDGE